MRAALPPLTRFFHVPYFAVGADGSVTQAKSEAEIRTFNQMRVYTENLIP